MHASILLFRHSAIPLFHHSAILPFRYSAIPLFRHSAIPLFLSARNALHVCFKTKPHAHVRFFPKPLLWSMYIACGQYIACSTADCSKLASVENQQAGTTDHSSKNILHYSFVPNLTVQTFVSCLPISGGKFAAICCTTHRGSVITVAW